MRDELGTILLAALFKVLEKLARDSFIPGLYKAAHVK